MMKRCFLLVLLPLWCLNAPGLLASDELGSKAMYVKITPGMVVNYGEPSVSRLRYLKVSVHVRVKSVSDSEVIEHHLPGLQDLLVTSLSAQDEEVIRSSAGKEEIRQNLLSEFQRYIEKEEGESVVLDLLFAAFIVQR